MLMFNASSGASDIFDGSSQTDHFEFEVTEETNADGIYYSINRCSPKQTEDIDATYTLVIPGTINDKPLHLGTEAFNWWDYSGDNFNYGVNLVFEGTNGEYVKFPNNCSKMFFETNAYEGGSEIRTKLVSIDFGQTDTSNVTDMMCMFYGCFGLTELNLSNFNTSNVTSMFQMFHGCYNLHTINLSSFNTSSVNNMGFMFCNCISLNELLLPESFDTSNVTSMLYMFNNCATLPELSLPAKFDTNAVTDMQCMFYRCYSLASLNIFPLFNISSNEVNVTSMFGDCKGDIKITGVTQCEFAKSENEIKSQIKHNADSVYTVTNILGVADSLVTVINTQIPNATFSRKIVPDCTNLFGATSDDAIYIGMNTPNQTVVADGINRIISGALINKTISGIGYYPANLQLTGTITLSGNNSEFSEKLFIVGDGTKNTNITLNNTASLPQTVIDIKANGTLIFSGTENYTLSNNVTVKPGGYLRALKRLSLSNGVTLKFE